LVFFLLPVVYFCVSLVFQEQKMSVRATGRLIGDVVTISAFPKSPPMVVQSVDEVRKLITTVWFTAGDVFQEGSFPAGALDRVEAGKPTQSKKRSKKR
jgi:hypothetical protein